jgi:CheY-like chemotaxis protein
VDSLILWVVLGVIAFAAFAWRMQRAKKKDAADRAAREAIAAATLTAAKAEIQSEAEAQRVETERKAANKARREASRAAAGRVIQAEADRVRELRAARTAEAERAAREAARRAVLEANQEAAEAAQRRAAEEARLAAREAARADAPAATPDPAPAIRAVPTPTLPTSAPARAQVVQQEPVAAVAPSAPAAAATPAPVAAKSPEETLILVADDSKVVRLKAGRLLAQHGYRVMYAVDGEDAVRQVDAELPDLVITDVEMPNLDGFGLTRHLRGNARTAHLPIVMITSIDATHREAALREGVGLVLGKPFPEEPLLAHIRSFRFPLGVHAPVRPASRPGFAQTEAGALA